MKTLVRAVAYNFGMRWLNGLEYGLCLSEIGWLSLSCTAYNDELKMIAQGKLKRPTVTCTEWYENDVVMVLFYFEEELSV